MEVPKECDKKKKKSKKKLSASSAANKTDQYLQPQSTSMDSMSSKAALSATNKKGQVPDQNSKSPGNSQEATTSEEGKNLDTSNPIPLGTDKYWEKAKERVKENNSHLIGQEKASTLTNTDKKQNKNRTRSDKKKKSNASATVDNAEKLGSSDSSLKDKSSGFNVEEKEKPNENCKSNEILEEMYLDDSIMEVPVPPKPVPLLVNLDETESFAEKDEIRLADEANMPIETNVPRTTADEKSSPNGTEDVDNMRQSKDKNDSES